MGKMKVFSLTFVSVVLACCVAACGGKTSIGGASESPTAAESTEPSPEVSSDLGGRTIRIAANWDDSPKPDSDMGKALIEQQKKVEQKYKVKIQYVNVPYDQYMQNFTSSVLAGKPMADLTLLGADWALTAAANDQLIPLKDFIDINKSKVFKKFAPLKGVDYGFGAPNNDTGGVLYNIDLVKKLGLTDPQELYKQNKWNWDEFEKLAKQATQDTNNDGKPDTWGWAGWNAEAAQFLIISNGSLIADDQNGKEGLSDPRTIEALDFLKKLYNVDHVVKVKKGDVDNWEERTTFADGDVLMTYAWGWLTDEYRKNNINYGYVPFPMGPKATDYLVPMSGGAAWFIAKGVENPRIVAQIYEELKDVPSKEVYPGQDWMESKLSRQQDIELFKTMVTKQVLVSSFNAFPDYPFYKVVSDVVKNNISAQTAVEKVKDQAQASIDKILKAK